MRGEYTKDARAFVLKLFLVISGNETEMVTETYITVI